MESAPLMPPFKRLVDGIKRVSFLRRASRARAISCLSRRSDRIDFSIFSFFFCLNHTAFKLYSLGHVGCLLDDSYGLHICSRVPLLLYNPARRPASTEPPRLSG
jgi:hypothetical protein